MGDAHGVAELAMKAIAVVDARPKAIAAIDEYDYGIWLRAAYEGGAISRASFRERRKTWLGAVRARVEDRSWARNNRAIYMATCAREVSNVDHDEAVEAIDNLDFDDFKLGYARNSTIAPTLGAILLAAGHVDEALIQLESAANTCTIDMIYQMRPAFDLGRARAMKGDRAGACQAFAKVLRRWGHAKPRSVTAEKARAEATKLGCDPVP